MSVKNERSLQTQREEDIAGLVRSALWLWGRSSPRRRVLFLRLAWRILRANYRRKRIQRRLRITIPVVLAISPTMRCNYNCQGCYSCGRPENEELTHSELNTIFEEGEQLGIPSVVVTGGEPFLREDLPDLIVRHRRMLFVVITNGSLVTPRLSRLLSRESNTVFLVSIEGDSRYTDARRGEGAYGRALQAMAYLKEAGACFGFAATNNRENTAYLGSDAFIDRMIAAGCMLGFFTEYVPVGSNPRWDWLLDEEQRRDFRCQILQLRRTKPIVLIQFPHDEYGVENLCSAAGRSSLHINSQGGVEPCPFVSIACENIRQGGLLAACKSPFLQAIREKPELLRRRRYACSLFENSEEVKALARFQKGL